MQELTRRCGVSGKVGFAALAGSLALAVARAAAEEGREKKRSLTPRGVVAPNLLLLREKSELTGQRLQECGRAVGSRLSAACSDADRPRNIRAAARPHTRVRAQSNAKTTMDDGASDFWTHIVTWYISVLGGLFSCVVIAGIILKT